VRLLSGQAIPPRLQNARGPLLAQSVAMLRRGRRFGGAIAQLADAVHRGDGAQARPALSGHDALNWVEHGQPQTICEMALREAAWVECLRAARAPCADDAAARDGRTLRVLAGLDAFRVLCAVRGGPWGVEQVNAALERALSVAFARDGGVRWVCPGRLAHVETALAMTVHKSQGSEFAHVALLLGPGGAVSSEPLYTAITRARSRLSLVSAHAGLLDAGVQRVTRRSGGLLARLQEGGDISS
jgi:exodeoxyribonuclease V alpha subunit